MPEPDDGGVVVVVAELEVVVGVLVDVVVAGVLVDVVVAGALEVVAAVVDVVVVDVLVDVVAEVEVVVTGALVVVIADVEVVVVVVVVGFGFLDLVGLYFVALRPAAVRLCVDVVDVEVRDRSHDVHVDARCGPEVEVTVVVDRFTKSCQVFGRPKVTPSVRRGAVAASAGAGDNSRNVVGIPATTRAVAITAVARRQRSVRVVCR